MKRFFIKIGKAIGYILIALCVLWACKDVFFTSVEKANTETPNQVELNIP